MDSKEAMSCKGVITLIDAKDVPGENRTSHDEPLFATEKVCTCQFLDVEVKSLA